MRDTGTLKTMSWTDRGKCFCWKKPEPYEENILRESIQKGILFRAGTWYDFKFEGVYL